MDGAMDEIGGRNVAERQTKVGEANTRTIINDRFPATEYRVPDRPGCCLIMR